MKARMHELIENGSAKNQTVILSFEYANGKVNDKHFAYTDDKDEFTYLGCRYDVVKEEVKGNRIYFYCVADNAETQLMVQFEDQQKINFGDTNHSQKNTFSWLKIFQYDYITTDRLSVKNKIACFSFTYCDLKLPRHESVFLSKSNPPPEV